MAGFQHGFSRALAAAAMLLATAADGAVAATHRTVVISPESFRSLLPGDTAGLTQSPFGLNAPGKTLWRGVRIPAGAVITALEILALPGGPAAGTVKLVRLRVREGEEVCTDPVCAIASLDLGDLAGGDPLVWAALADTTPVPARRRVLRAYRYVVLAQFGTGTTVGSVKIRYTLP